MRYAGASGQLTVRADSGFYTHGVVSVCRKMDVRFSITIRQHKSLRHLIEAIPETDWTPIPYWMDGAADVAETTYTPFESRIVQVGGLGRFSPGMCYVLGVHQAAATAGSVTASGS